MARVLVIDDDDALRRACVRLLIGDGHDVHSAEDGAMGSTWLRQNNCDAVVTDLSLPDMDGIDVLRSLRDADDGVPIVVVTGNPSVESAAGAMEFGVYRYLSKPYDPVRLREAVRRAATTRADNTPTNPREVTAVLTPVFERALAGLWLAVQPVVDVSARRVVAYEALLRTTEPALARPDEFIRTAEILGRFTELARAVRRAAGVRVKSVPGDAMLFVNLHPAELLDDELFDPSELGVHAHRVVLEITERARLSEIADLSARVDAMRRLGFRIAVDDLGEGYAGLSAVAALDPDVLKLDMSLVRGVEKSAVKRSLVRAMVAMCRGLDRNLIAEGVETPEERAVLEESGVTWMQGYLFARPNQAFQIPEFGS